MNSLLKPPKRLYIRPMRNSNQPTRWDHELSSERPCRLYHFVSKATVGDVRPDMHYSAHLGILLNGEFDSVYPDFTKTNTQGDVWFTSPWEPHAAKRTGKATDILLFSALPERIGEIGLETDIEWLSPFLVSPASRPVVGNLHLREKILKLGMELKEIADSPSKTPGDSAYCWLKFHELLLTLIRGTNFNEFLRASNMPTLMERIAPSLKLARSARGEFPSIEDAAASCGLGRSRFSAIFKEAMGVSFAKFAARARIGTAAVDVKRNLIPIKEIAEMYGFHDESHFNHAFKRHFKLTPGEYRK